MPGAVYRNSSSPSGGRKERGERRDAPLSFGPEHPANVRTSVSREIEKEPDSPLSTPLSASQGKSGPRPTRSHAGKNDGQASALRAWEVRLTPSMLIMLAVLTLVTLCFFFLFGLIIGRGSVPPPPQPELEHLLPQTSATAPEAPEHILPEEELRFMTNLKSDATAAVGDTSGEQTAPAPAPASQVKPSQAGNPKPAASARQDTGKYDFVLRVAAFKAEEQADALRAKLEGAGMRTRMVKQKAQKGTWHFVQVLYRGTTDNMQALRDTLGELGLKDSIVSSKTPVR